MATVARLPRSAGAGPRPRGAVAGDRRIIIRGVGWHVYDVLSEAIGERQHVRLAFDGEDLEIMTVGYPHERYKEMLGKIVAAVTRAKKIPRKTAGEATWKRPEIGRGLQADECYYFLPEKLVVAYGRRTNRPNTGLYQFLRHTW